MMSAIHVLTPGLGTTVVGPLGTSLAAWVFVPLALYVLGLGLGLLLEAVSGHRVPPGLLVPVGVCTAVVVALPTYRIGLGAWAALALTAALALAGILLDPARARTCANGGVWCALAGLVVYGLYMAPVILAGGWTWTGYNFVNDTAVQFLLATHLYHVGATMPLGPPKAPPQSTALEHVRIYLDTAYPLGVHALLATLSAGLRLRPEVIYQPLISGFAGAAAMALAWMLEQVTLKRLMAALVAVVALAANLTYNYALQGNAKEIGVLMALIVAAAAGRWAVTSPAPVRAIGVTALPLAAAITLYSSAAVPYVGAFALVLLLATFVQPGAPLRRALVRSTLVGAVVLVVASAATLVTLARSAQVVQGTFSASNPNADLGQLVRPLPLIEAAGTWLTSDYRLPVSGIAHDVTTLLIVLTFVLGAGALVVCLLRRESGPLILLVPMVLTLVVIRPRVSPYAAAKMLALMAPTIVALAGVGAAVLAARVWRPAAYLALAALAAGVLVSDALIYHSVRLAPTGRMEAMRDVGRHYAHSRGLMLVDDMDEFAKYFMEPTRMNVALELVTPKPAYNQLSGSFMPRNADLDQMPLAYVESFPLIAQRRGPDASRPPANFRIDYQNRYFRVWRRVGPARSVLEHIPLQGPLQGTAPFTCPAADQLHKQMGRGEEVVASVPPAMVTLDTATVAHPRGWLADGEMPRSLDPHTPGSAQAVLPFKRGMYEMWIAGSTGRVLTVNLDGRRVGSAVGVDTNGESLPAGTVAVAAGRHRVAIKRAAGNLQPGNGYQGVIGPVVFERLPAVARLIRTRNPRALCNRQLDWVEVVRP